MSIHYIGGCDSPYTVGTEVNQEGGSRPATVRLYGRDNVAPGSHVHLFLSSVDARAVAIRLLLAADQADQQS